MTDGRRKSKKQELLMAGVEELNTHGIVDFSVRRVAEVVGVSPGAPYKHFQNKNEFIAAIISYNYSKWYKQLEEISNQYPNDYCRQLVEIITMHVSFLVENPHFRSALMVKDDALDEGHRGLRTSVSKVVNETARACAEQVGGISEEAFQRKYFLLRSFMYGAAHLFETGEQEYTPENLNMVRELIAREMRLP